MFLWSDFHETFGIAFWVYIYVVRKVSWKSLHRNILKFYILMTNFGHFSVKMPKNVNLANFGRLWRGHFLELEKNKNCSMTHIVCTFNISKSKVKIPKCQFYPNVHLPDHCGLIKKYISLFTVHNYCSCYTFSLWAHYFLYVMLKEKYEFGQDIS